MLSQRLWPVRYQWTPVIRLVVVAIAVCVIGLLLPQLNIWLSLSARVLLLAGYASSLWHAGVPSADDRLAIAQLIPSRGLGLVAIKERR